MAEGSSKRIKITIKTPKEKKDIEVDEEETVEKVIRKALKRFILEKKFTCRKHEIMFRKRKSHSYES